MSFEMGQLTCISFSLSCNRDKAKRWDTFWPQWTSYWFLRHDPAGENCREMPLGGIGALGIKKSAHGVNNNKAGRREASPTGAHHQAPTNRFEPPQLDSQ